MTEANTQVNPGENPEGSQQAPGDGQQPDKKVEETPQEEKKDAATGGDEMVTIPKKKYERLTAVHNSQNANLRTRNRTRGSEGFSFETPQVQVPPSEEEIDYAQQSEFAKVKQGIMDLAFDNPQIGELVKTDPVLKKVLKNNPLSLLDVTPRDAEDALDLLEETLLDMIKPLTKTETKEDEKKPEPQPAPQAPRQGPEQPKTTYHNTMAGVEKGLLDRIGG